MLLAGQSFGYSSLQQQGAGTFTVKAALDASGNDKVVKYLQSIDTASSNIQLTNVGFESPDASSIEVFTTDSCMSASTCDGYYQAGSDSTDQVCIADGLCIESSVVDETEQTLTTTITSDDGSWFGIGFSTPGGGMAAGGAGADIFVCSKEGLRRFATVTQKNNPESSANIELITEDSPDSETVPLFPANPKPSFGPMAQKANKPCLLNYSKIIVFYVDSFSS